MRKLCLEVPLEACITKDYTCLCMGCCNVLPSGCNATPTKEVYCPLYGCPKHKADIAEEEVVK